MNEVSFRDSILDSIDTIVTESSNDVLFSLLDTADKAMMIMENCADTDDIWKYSIWQEADGNAEQIDKDKHPFKENSTLKTILMLPINLIKFIFKTISQAFSPQKTEEASKLQKIASAAPKVANKVAGWFINEDGEIRWPVWVTTAGGTAITIDAIVAKIRGKDGLAVKFFNLIKDWISSHFGKLHKIAKRYNQNFPDSVSCDLKADGDNPSYETNLNIEQADKYLKSCGEIFNTLDDKIKAIADAKDDSVKNKLSKELRAAIGKNLVLIPFVNSKQTYTLDQITNFYKTHSELLKQSFNQDTVSKFTTSYSAAIQSTKKDTDKKTGAQNKEESFAGHIDPEAVNSVNVFMSAMSEVVIFIKNLQDGTNQINTVIADILKAAGVSDDSQITSVEEKGTAEQPETEIKKVEETPKPEPAPETQEPAEQNVENTPAAGEQTETPTDETGSTEASSEPSTETQSENSVITPEENKGYTSQQALDYAKSKGQYRNATTNEKGQVINSKGIAIQKLDGFGPKKFMRHSDGLWYLEYAADDDFDIVDTHYTAYVEFYDEETGDIVEEAFVDEDNDVCYVLEGGTYLGGSTVKRIYTPKSKFTVDVNDDPISIEDDKQLEEKLASLDSAKDRTRTVKIKPTAKGLTVDYISTKVSNNKSVRIDTGHRLVITGAAAVKKSNIMRNKDNVEKTSKQSKTIRIGKLGEEQKKSLKPDRDKAVQESYDASIDATVSSWYNK